MRLPTILPWCYGSCKRANFKVELCLPGNNFIYRLQQHDLNELHSHSTVTDFARFLG